MSAVQKISAVIFDLDGLLLDTEPLYQQAYQQICSKFGKDYSDAVRVNVIGKAERLGASIIARDLQIPMTPEEILTERDEIMETLFPTAKELKGARRLCEHLAAHKVPIAVATSSNSHSVELKTRNHKQWFSVFGDKITRGDNPLVKKGKPEPDIFLVAAKSLGAEPSSCLVFEDSPSGVQAGKAAGMTVVSVPDPLMHSTNPKLYEIADAIIPSLADFKPEQYSLPPFK